VHRSLPLVFFVLWVAVGLPAGATVISDYAVQVSVHPDSHLSVTETITVNFGDDQKHGIYRTIPVAYERSAHFGGLSAPANYNMRLHLHAITDESGGPYRYRTLHEGRNLVFRIGDPDRLVSGVKTYKLTYDVDRAINFFPDHDEIYWNVTGTEWEWPIKRVRCFVDLPKNVDDTKVRYRTFTGRYGSEENTAKAVLKDHTLIASAAFEEAGEGLTVLLSVPKGVLQEPTSLRKFLWFLQDNGYVIGMLLMPFLTLGIMLTLFLKNGRDPERGLPIAVQYEPPHLTPAEVGTLVDERADTADIISTVIDLAVRGYIKIKEIETKKLLFLSSKDYEFTRLKNTDDSLESHEVRFMSGLFGGAPTVLLSDLKQKFYTHLPGIRDSIYTQLVEKDLFPARPDQVRSRYIGIGMAAVGIPLFFGLFLPAVNGSGDAAFARIIPAAVFSFLACAAIVGIFGRVMPRKTARGSQAARQSLGFKEFVERVEKDHIARMATEDPSVFERMLPYAVVLGVADQWAEKFRDLLTEPPGWYESPRYGSGYFQPGVFVNDLGSGMNTMASTFTSTPPSSAGSGSSGFSSGGGSSGGGFGGGGGGGW
jgi:uncharacterized membrane protein